jgi:triacylglycerol lipase
MVGNYKFSFNKSHLLVAKELLANAALALLYPFGLAASKKKTIRKKEQRTLVMLHGYGANRSNFYPLAAYLRLRGIKKILFYNYPSNMGAEKAAINFKEYLRKHVRGGDIDLIGHSMGGIVARTYLQLLGGPRRVKRCITLGTPHLGTYNAYWIPTKVGNELRPESELIKKLDSTRANSENVQFFSMTAGADNIILPRDSSQYGEANYFPDIGHMGLLLSKQVMKKVANYLALDHLNYQ